MKTNFLALLFSCLTALSFAKDGRKNATNLGNPNMVQLSVIQLNNTDNANEKDGTYSVFVKNNDESLNPLYFGNRELVSFVSDNSNVELPDAMIHPLFEYSRLDN